MSKVTDKIDKVLYHLRIALGKIAVARNAYEKHKRTRGLDMLSFISALHGLPVNYAVIADIYISSANKDLEKSLRLLVKVENLMMKKHPAIYSRCRGSFVEVKELILLAEKFSSLQEKYNAVSNAFDKLSSLKKYLELVNI